MPAQPAAVDRAAHCSRTLAGSVRPIWSNLALPCRRGSARCLNASCACRTPALGGELFHCPDCGHSTTAIIPATTGIVRCAGAPTPTTGSSATPALAAAGALFSGHLHRAGRTAELDPVPSPARFDSALCRQRPSPAGPGRQSQTPRRHNWACSGVLHTWSRTLIYHPHIHYLVPGGGLSPDQRQWIASFPKVPLPSNTLG